MATATHKLILEAVAEIIRDLHLVGPSDTTPLPDDRVYVRKLPRLTNLTLPCVQVTLPLNVKETVEHGTNVQDDYGYPCMITIVAANNQDLSFVEGDEGGELLWRQQIRDVFHNKRPQVMIDRCPVPLKRCLWEPGEIANKAAFDEANLFVSPMIVWVKTRETR